MGRGVPESICEKYFRTCTPLPACARSAQADLPLKGGGVRSELRVLNLRHAAGAAPALERGPDRALEPEAVDRRRAFQRADAVEPDPGPLEAAFLQHPPRGRIGDAGTGLQRLELEIGEGVVDQGARRLGGEAAAPVRHAEPAAELRHQARSARPVAQLEPARADERALGERDHERRLAVRPVGRGQERFGIRERIGMRDARRVLGDAALVGEHRDVLGVLGTRRAQHQPLGLEDGNTRLPQALRGDRVQQRHGTGSFAPKKRRGEPASRLPSWNPIGSAGSMDAGGRTNFRRLVCRGLRHRDHGYVGAAFGLGLELDSPVGQREQRVILADAHVLAGVPFGAALARKDIAGEHRLAAEQFHAEATARRIPAVARGTACFLVSHEFAALLSSIFYADSVTESYHFFFPLPLSAAGFFAAGFFVGAAGFSALGLAASFFTGFATALGLAGFASAFAAGAGGLASAFSAGAFGFASACGAGGAAAGAAGVGAAGAGWGAGAGGSARAASTRGAASACGASSVLAVGFLPSVRISVMRTTENSWRWPRLRREFLRRRFLNAMTFSPRPCSTISPATVAPATIGLPITTLSPPTSSTSPNWTASPGWPEILSTVIRSCSATRYCFPPVLMIANMARSRVWPRRSDRRSDLSLLPGRPPPGRPACQIFRAKR